MLEKFALALIVGAGAASAFAQAVADVKANPGSSAYSQDGRGVIVRSAFGLCWRTGYWSPTDAVAGCDGELVVPVAKATAPAIVPSPVRETAAPVPPPPLAAAAPKRCDFSVTLENDQTFEFGKSVLRIPAKKRIDTEILGKLPSCGKIEIILVTGHADRLGSQQYNQALSTRRADAVAAYLTAKGVSAHMDTLGMGKTQAIKTCGNKLSRKELITCLTPNRRVVVEVKGLAKIN